MTETVVINTSVFSMSSSVQFNRPFIVIIDILKCVYRPAEIIISIK